MSNKVYDPAEDSFLFLDALELEEDRIRKLKPSVIVEIGSGSGILGCFLAKNLVDIPPTVIGIDINPEAAVASSATAAMNGVAADYVMGNLFSSIKANNNIDVVLFNPVSITNGEFLA